MVISDTVTIALISTIGTVVTTLLAAIVAIVNSTRNKVGEVHTLVNAEFQKMKADLAAALATIDIQKGLIAKKENPNGG